MTDEAVADRVDTRTALLDAAESEFAEQGYGQASLRAIMRRAGTDPGAVHYHFADRAGLAAAVLDRLLVPLNDRRLALLAEVEAAPEAGPETPSVTQLMEALLRPDVELATALDQREQGRARLVGAMYLRPASFVLTQVEARFGPVAARFHPHLMAAVPHVAPDVLAWRVRWGVFGLVGAVLADDGGDVGADPDELLARLVSTAAGALTAVHPPGDSP